MGRLLKKTRRQQELQTWLPVSTTCGDRYIHRQVEGDREVLKCLERGTVSISRLGTTESAITQHFETHRAMNGCALPERLIQSLVTLSGFFPASEDLAVRFAVEYLTEIAQLDLIGVRWEKHDKQFFAAEYNLINRYNATGKLVGLENVTNPFTSALPWTTFLKDKKVLVVHPFAETIRSQYSKRETLFKRPGILPEFDLQVLQAVQSIAGCHPKGFATWFDARDAMIDQISEKEFDIALIGAGAYGMSLSNTCKKIGRSAVHMGGSLQVLFGIKGARWVNPGPDSISELVNDAWVSPLAAETPENFSHVEGGCYW
jgi:hypothetical protein